jgi:hypothetical protein
MHRHELEGTAEATLAAAGQGDSWPVSVLAIASSLGISMVPNDARGHEIKPIVGASWAALARRVPAVASAVVQCWDRRPGQTQLRPTWRAASPWLQPVLRRRAFDCERALAELCLDAGEHTHEDALVDAYLVERDGWSRVLTVYGVEELEARVPVRDVRRRGSYSTNQERLSDVPDAAE